MGLFSKKPKVSVVELPPIDWASVRATFESGDDAPGIVWCQDDADVTHFSWDVSGESHYATELGAILVDWGEEFEPERFEALAPAVLVREPAHEFDPNAVAVLVDGRKVGYLERDVARAAAPILDLAASKLGVRIACTAKVRGRAGGVNTGVWLNFDLPG